MNLKPKWPWKSKKQPQMPFNSKTGFKSEFKLSNGHSQDHLEVAYDQGENGDLPNSLTPTPAQNHSPSSETT